MSSWCAICHRKLQADYYHYKGEKVHKKCLPKKVPNTKKEVENDRQNSGNNR